MPPVVFNLDRVNERDICRKLQKVKFPCYVWIDGQDVKIVSKDQVAGAGVPHRARDISRYKALVVVLLQFTQENLLDLLQPAVPAPAVPVPQERFIRFTRRQATDRNILARLGRVRFPCRVWYDDDDEINVLNEEDEVGVDDWEEDASVPDVPDDATTIGEFRDLVQILLNLIEANLNAFLDQQQNQ